MRRVIIISMLAFGLIAVSCQKAQIAPNAGTMDAPEWENVDKSGEGLDNSKPDGSADGVRITDPNEDPDSNPNGNPNSGDD